MTRMTNAEPTADDEQQVGVLHSEVTGTIADIARTPAVQWVVRGQQIDRLPAGRNGNT